MKDNQKQVTHVGSEVEPAVDIPTPSNVNIYNIYIYNIMNNKEAKEIKCCGCFGGHQTNMKQ